MSRNSLIHIAYDAEKLGFSFLMTNDLQKKLGFSFLVTNNLQKKLGFSFLTSKDLPKKLSCYSSRRTTCRKTRVSVLAVNHKRSHDFFIILAVNYPRIFSRGAPPTSLSSAELDLERIGSNEDNHLPWKSQLPRLEPTSFSLLLP